MAQLTVLDPVATTQGDLRWQPLAPRPAGLSGKRIGLWWNIKRGGEVALKRVGEHLQRRYADVELVWIQEFYPVKPEVVDRAIRECQVVVGATGD